MVAVWNWKADLGRVVLGGLGSVVALTIAGWPDDAAVTAWIGLAGLVVGIALSFGAEYVVHLHAEVRRLHGIEGDLEHERTRWDQERRLRDEQLVLARREAAISAVETKVWGDAFIESQKTGNFMPLSVIMARREVLMKARNLHLPLSSQTSQDKKAA